MRGATFWRKHPLCLYSSDCVEKVEQDNDRVQNEEIFGALLRLLSVNLVNLGQINVSI